MMEAVTRKLGTGRYGTPWHFARTEQRGAKNLLVMRGGLPTVVHLLHQGAFIVRLIAAGFGRGGSPLWQKPQT